MNKRSEITAERVRSLLSYDEETGEFKWATRCCNRMKLGDKAGGVKSDGYVVIRINGLKCMAHRVAWLYVYGEWPKHEIDHINLVRTDNRIKNLRPVTRGENEHNKYLRKDNTSGYKGVSWRAGFGKWVVQIQHQYKKIYLGSFALLEDAVATYENAAATLHTNSPYATNKERKAASGFVAVEARE